MTQEAGHSFFIYVCEQEVIATSMDHNITGQGDLNRDHPNQEDITREKNISEVPGSNENWTLRTPRLKNHTRGAWIPRSPRLKTRIREAWILREHLPEQGSRGA